MKSVEPVKVWLPVLLPREIFSVISTGSEQPCSGHWAIPRKAQSGYSESGSVKAVLRVAASERCGCHN